MSRTRTVVLVLAAACAVAGCGRTGGAATTVADSYLHDLGDRNYGAACQLLTDQLLSQLGDCPSALRKRHGDLPVGEYAELRDASVSRVTYQGSDKALVYPQDIRIHRTVTVTVKGTPTPRSSAVRSIAANHATDGKGLELTKVGKVWRISGGGV